jgi:hypothetical protein
MCTQALAPSATEYLAAKGFDPVFGGRPVKRVIQRELETPLARAILRGDFQVRYHGIGNAAVLLYLDGRCVGGHHARYQAEVRWFQGVFAGNDILCGETWC